MTHICVGKLTSIGSDNGLSPERRQAIIWTNAEILLIGPLGTNFSEILIEIQTFSLKKIHLKMSSAKCCSFRLGLNVLILYYHTGPWFNIKMLSYQDRKSHCGDNTILRPSYLHNGISITGKTTSLYWIRALVIIRGPSQLERRSYQVWQFPC